MLNIYAQTDAGLAIGNGECKGWTIFGVGEAEAAATSIAASFAKDPQVSERVESGRRSLKRVGKYRRFVRATRPGLAQGQERRTSG